MCIYIYIYGFIVYCISNIYTSLYVYTNIDIFGQIHTNSLVGVAVSVEERIEFSRVWQDCFYILFYCMYFEFLLPIIIAFVTLMKQFKIAS